MTEHDPATLTLEDATPRATPQDYAAFLESKQTLAPTGPISHTRRRPPDAVPVPAGPRRWAVRKGRAALFADTGLGKTFMQLEWARLHRQARRSSSRRCRSPARRAARPRRSG